jgi:UrcA family protein
MNRAILLLPELRRTSLAFAALSACLLAGAAGVAQAAAPGDAVPSITVAYGDLNLATAQGTDALYARIVAAARQVCGAGNVDIRDLGALTAVRTCETQAIGRAVREVNSPRLAALHSAHLGHG